MSTAPPVVVRTAWAADVDAVVALVHAAYRGEPSRAGWTTEADLLDGGRTDAAMVAAILADAASELLVVDDPPGLLACCHLQRRGRAAYLGMFAVRPDRQGGGVGAAVMAAAEEWALAWGADRMELTVLNHRPELQAWYERCGYVLTGHLEPFPYGDERFGVPRRDDLVLQQMIKPLRGATEEPRMGS